MTAAPGIAATELGLLAGADRVEGCLFGNGERTGNVDLVTVGLNLYTQGIDPKIDFSRHRGDQDRRSNIATRSRCIRAIPMAAIWSSRPFPVRIRTRSRKALLRRRRAMTSFGKCPICRSIRTISAVSYEAVIRVNSQSGKGGVAWVLEQDQGLKLPKRLQANFSLVVQELADETSRELNADDIWERFQEPLWPRRRTEIRTGRI